MKNNRQYESRVKRNAVIIYLLAAMLCIGMIYYIFNLKISIEHQKDNINKNERILSLINKLIENVNNAQAYANIYTHSSDEQYKTNFNKSLSEISKLNDSITILHEDSFNTKTLDEVINLLRKKEKIINDINAQLNSYNPYKEIYTIIDNYQPKQQTTTIQTTKQDTIVYLPEKKGFFQRLGDVFSPDKSLDSLVLVSKTTIDTLTSEDNTIELLNEIQLHTEKGRKEYARQIKLVEKQYNNLILSDNTISNEISDLLIILHKQTLDSVVIEIQNSENLINKNINLSIALASIALLLILTFIFLIFYDVKRVIAARKATEEAQKRTEETMKSRHNLLLSVSHDVKAPLSSILGYLELMQLENSSDKDRQKISSMINSAEHILSLLTNLLNFSRLDQGKEAPIISDFNIKELCDELSLMFSPLADNKHLQFLYENSLEEKTFVKSDALKIKQIVSNLLSNAIKYTKEGNISFKVDKNENDIVFDICDEGIGIPQDKLKEIFKPFSRIDNKESLIEGNGFGLFVVKGLINLLNGNIKVESELNKGSHFIVSIPVEFIDNKNEVIENKEIKDYKTDNRQNILVIDDDNTLLAVIESMLNKTGCLCDVCQSSIDFENCCNDLSRYDFILTDREMGAFSGLDVLNKIKNIDSEKKVILMTARSEYNDDIALQKGFDGYLRKPFSINDLVNLLNANIPHYETRTNKSKYQEEFPELCSLFENDDTSIENILRIFIQNTSDNLIIFNELINEDHFDKAANLCHKICPMFVQLGQTEAAEFLYKMDGLRGKDKTLFPGWKDESIKFMKSADDLITLITEKYGIE